MPLYKVHNLHEDRPGDWIEYWEKATGQKAGFCHRVDCPNSPENATDGAHVQLDDPDDNRWWIVPLCHKCNCQFGEHFTVSGPLVSCVDPDDILW